MMMIIIIIIIINNDFHGTSSFIVFVTKVMNQVTNYIFYVSHG